MNSEQLSQARANSFWFLFSAKSPMSDLRPVYYAGQWHNHTELVCTRPLIANANTRTRRVHFYAFEIHRLFIKKIVRYFSLLEIVFFPLFFILRSVFVGTFSFTARVSYNLSKTRSSVDLIIYRWLAPSCISMHPASACKCNAPLCIYYIIVFLWNITFRGVKSRPSGEKVAYSSVHVWPEIIHYDSNIILYESIARAALNRRRHIGIV